MPDGENIELSMEAAQKLRDDLDRALPAKIAWYLPTEYYEYPTISPSHVYPTITCTTGIAAG